MVKQLTFREKYRRKEENEVLGAFQFLIQLSLNAIILIL